MLPTIYALSNDVHVNRYFNHFNTLREHFDSAVYVADHSNVDDSANHLLNHISKVCSHGQGMTVSDKLELTSTLFFTDTTALKALSDSLGVNLSAIYSTYTTTYLPDSLGEVYLLLYPSNQAANTCETTYSRAQIHAMTESVGVVSRCISLNCFAGEEICMLGCRVASAAGFVTA
jgi:hypothetical protein